MVSNYKVLRNVPAHKSKRLPLQVGISTTAFGLTLAFSEHSRLPSSPFSPDLGTQRSARGASKGMPSSRAWSSDLLSEATPLIIHSGQIFLAKGI